MKLVFNDAGVCLEKITTNPEPPFEALQANFGPNIYQGETEDPVITDPEVMESQITADVNPETGEVSNIILVPGPPDVFLHVGVDAPGTGPTGVPSVAADETATVNATIRSGADPESPVIPYPGTVRAPYYMNGAYHGELRMEFAAGVCVYIFEPKSHHHGRLTINEDEIGLLQGMKVRLVGEVELIVDEKSAA